MPYEAAHLLHEFRAGVAAQSGRNSHTDRCRLRNSFIRATLTCHAGLAAPCRGAAVVAEAAPTPGGPRKIPPPISSKTL